MKPQADYCLWLFFLEVLFMSNSISHKFSMHRLLLFTLPSILMMIFVAIYLMANSILIAKYIGQDALEATNIVFPLISVFLAIAIMYATGSNAIISANLGEGNEQKARENFTVIVIVGIITGVALTIAMQVFCRPIVTLLGATENLMPYCIKYLSTYSYIIPFIFIQIASQYFFVTIGKPIHGMISNMTGGVLCLATCYITIAKMKMGLLGSVLGLGCSFVIPAIFFIFYFLFNKSNSLYFVKPKLHKAFLFHSCTNGSSEMVTNLAIAVVTATLNLIMMKLVGEDGVAAVTVIVQVQFFFNSIYIGFGAGIAPIFAYAQGSEDHEQTKTVFKLALIFVLISSVLLVIVSYLLNDMIVGAFISPINPAYSLAKTGFCIFALGYFFAGFNIFTSVFFTSLSNGKLSALISFLRTFLYILSMLLILPPIWGTTGVWLAIPFGETMTAITGFIMLKKKQSTYHYKLSWRN